MRSSLAGNSLIWMRLKICFVIFFNHFLFYFVDFPPSICSLIWMDIKIDFYLFPLILNRFLLIWQFADLDADEDFLCIILYYLFFCGLSQLGVPKDWFLFDSIDFYWSGHLPIWIQMKISFVSFLYYLFFLWPSLLADLDVNKDLATRHRSLWAFCFGNACLPAFIQLLALIRN